MTLSEKLIPMLMKVPDSQLDSSMRPYIEKWSKPPKAIDVLEVVDYCINGALSSGVVITALQALYDERCKAEGTTHEEVVKGASWRIH